jgi:hypothetical protein
MPPSDCPSLRFAPDTFRGKRRCRLASPRTITDAARMDSDAFLESCRHDNEREVKNVRLPSLEEIETLKRQIRAENDAREAKKRCSPPYLRMYREPKVRRTSYSAGRITRPL